MATASNFKVGDIVRLKRHYAPEWLGLGFWYGYNAKTRMTVRSVGQQQGFPTVVSCAWFVKDVCHENTFAAEALEKVKGCE